jgi:hypothetical protein
MTHEVAFTVTANAVAQNEIVHAPADVDRIDLDVAMVGEGRRDVGRGFVEKQRPTQKLPGGEGSDAENGSGGHVPAIQRSRNRKNKAAPEKTGAALCNVLRYKLDWPRAMEGSAAAQAVARAGRP